MVPAASRSFGKDREGSGCGFGTSTQWGEGAHPRPEAQLQRVQTSLWGGIHPRVEDFLLCFQMQGATHLIDMSHLYRELYHQRLLLTDFPFYEGE